MKHSSYGPTAIKRYLNMNQNKRVPTAGPGTFYLVQFGRKRLSVIEIKMSK